MGHSRDEKIEALGRIIDTLDELRVKCPWDRKQTNESLRPNTIEEVYEPYLLQKGLIKRTPRGRMVTNDAYLKGEPIESESDRGKVHLSADRRSH